MRNILLKIASRDSKFRQTLIRKLGMEFSTQEALDAYLKSHPKANKKKHKVKDNSRGKSISSKGRDISDKHGRKMQESLHEMTEVLDFDLSTVLGKNSSVVEIMSMGTPNSNEFSSPKEEEDFFSKIPQELEKIQTMLSHTKPSSDEEKKVISRTQKALSTMLE